MVITVRLAELGMLQVGSSVAARRVASAGRGFDADGHDLHTGYPAMPPPPVHPATPPGRDPKAGRHHGDATPGQLFGDRSADLGPFDTPRGDQYR